MESLVGGVDRLITMKIAHIQLTFQLAQKNGLVTIPSITFLIQTTDTRYPAITIDKWTKRHRDLGS